MAGTDYLRIAKSHEVIGGVFGWLWLIGSPIGLIWIGLAVFTDASWIGALVTFLGAQFSKSVAREYRKAAQVASAKGVELGQLRVDETGLVHRVE